MIAAPNAFKGALDAAAAARAMAAGIAAAVPGAEIVELPLADGGDGTAEVLCAASGGRWRPARALHAWGHPGPARFGLLLDGSAVVDVAAASGLGRRRPGAAEALTATSFGTGQLCRLALEAGARRICLALGGSACTDGGAGLLSALGARLLDASGRPLPPGGAALAALAAVDLEPLRAWRGVQWTALVDVRNPLLGREGSARIFGPQKGAGPAEVARLELGLARWADALETASGRAARELPGAGAAGGCGFGLAAALDADLRPGAPFVLRAVDLAGRLPGAQLLLTGEGVLDAQTGYGKAPAAAALAAVAAGVPAVALAGALGPGWEGLLRPEGPLTAALALAPGPRGRPEALRATAADLGRTAAAAARLILAGAGLPRP